MRHITLNYIAGYDVLGLRRCRRWNDSNDEHDNRHYDTPREYPV